jgi:DNA-binding CsgD family transcriptional regulator
MEDGKLIGRSHELRVARQALESGRGLLVTGVAGMGKTRFLAELSRTMTDAGASVLLTNSANAVIDLAALEARHPVVIVDDAHRLDIRLLELLCEDAGRRAITLCLAGLPISEVDPAQAAALSPVVHAWISATGAPRLRLPALAGPDAIELAEACAAPHALGAFWGEKIRRMSGGLPALIKVYVADAVRRGRLAQLPELLDPEARELPPAEAIELLRPRLAGRDRSLLSALAVLGRLSGVTIDRAREIVRRGDITALVDAELLEIGADEAVHVAPAVADVASSLLTAEQESTALEHAADILMRFAPEGSRSPIEAVFLVGTWLRLNACGALASYPAGEVREVLLAAARLYTRAGRAQQALALLARCPRTAGGDAMTLIERARASAALHDHDGALALLREAEPLVADEREARMLLNRYNCVLVWHLGDKRAFEAVTARAQDWLPGSPAWRSELALPDRFRELAPGEGGADAASVSSYLAALPAHRGTRASALAAGFLGRVLASSRDGDDCDELLRMASLEASETLGGAVRSSAAHTATFQVRACLLMAALVRHEAPDALPAMLRDVVATATALGGQSVQNLAFAKWFEALCAESAGDADAARRSLAAIDTSTVPERLQTWIEIEYARALALTGDVAEARTLLRRVAPTVRASGDSRAAFALARARVSLKLGAGQATQATVLARTIAVRLEPASPALAALVLDEAQRRTPATQRAEELPDASAAAPSRGAGADRGEDVGRGEGPTSDRTAVITPIAPALHAAAWKLLSAREILVARLAATGRTNAQIAAELYLSVRTVESHLHHARVKLGVSGRDGLAAFFRASSPALEQAL